MPCPDVDGVGAASEGNVDEDVHVGGGLGRRPRVGPGMRERLACLQSHQGGPAAPAGLLPGRGLRAVGRGAPRLVGAVRQQISAEIQYVDRVQAQVPVDLGQGELRVGGLLPDGARGGRGAGNLVTGQAAELRHHHVDQDQLVGRGGVQRPRGGGQKLADLADAVHPVVVAKLICDLDADDAAPLGEHRYPADRGAEPGGPFLPALHQVGFDPHPEVIGDGHPHRRLVISDRGQRLGYRRRPATQRAGHLGGGAVLSPVAACGGDQGDDGPRQRGDHRPGNPEPEAAGHDAPTAAGPCPGR